MSPTASSLRNYDYNPADKKSILMLSKLNCVAHQYWFRPINLVLIACLFEVGILDAQPKSC